MDLFHAFRILNTSQSRRPNRVRRLRDGAPASAGAPVAARMRPGELTLRRAGA
jgi:hypothetical protein